MGDLLYVVAVYTLGAAMNRVFEPAHIHKEGDLFACFCGLFKALFSMTAETLIIGDGAGGVN